MHNNEKITASESLQLRLEESILSRQYLPGDRLPSEREIMIQLKVGRGTVREAYRSLQQKGLIEIKRGGGAYVREVDSAMVGDTLATLIRHRRVSTQHLQEFREAVESRCAAYAAERATEQQIDQLKQLLDQMEKRYQSLGKADLRFYEQELNLHTQLAKISGNPMFEWFAITFENNAAAFSNILAHGTEKIDEILNDWRDFISAVTRKEVTKAAMIIGSHIFRFRKILEDLERDKSA
jgi:DNA-binding FadR family transcriptional regulator